MNILLVKIYNFIKNKKQGYSKSPISIFRSLLESQYWVEDKTHAFQLAELNKLLSDCKISSKYYKDILREINLPLNNIEEFYQHIPILTKEIIKKQNNNLNTRYFRSNFKHSTSGTSGDPTIIYTSGLAEGYREAGSLRFLSWWDIMPFEKSVLILGKKASEKSGNFFFERLANVFRHRYDINVFKLDSHSIERHYVKINKFRPVYLRGFKSAIIHFAELLEQNNLIFDNFKFKLVIVTSEILLEKERQYIENIFDCKVANEYGSAEVGQIAFECPHGSMHVFSEAILLHTNEHNDVFITELHNNCMPLLNYKFNDKAILSGNSCKCGIKSQIISDIQGRDNDIIVKPNGEKASAILIIYIFMELDDIGLGSTVKKYKVIQEQNKFTILIVPDLFNSKVEDYIKNRFFEK